MKKYKAYATMSVDLVCEFELDEDDEDVKDPWTYAKYHIDGGDFTEIENSGDWALYDVQEIE
jgi:hypothetical protein